MHGAWHGAWAYDLLLPHLESAGLRARTVDLPSAGSRDGLDADAAAVRAALAQSPGPTVLVGHSYGGVVITEAAGGTDDVAGLVYLCAFLLDEGESLLGALQGQVPDWIEVDEAAGTSRAHRPHEVFYGDCPPEAAQAAADRLVPQSLASFAMPQTTTPWRTLPSTYVVCTQDKALPPPAQEAMSARAGTVVRLDRSHSPFLSAPDELARVLSDCVRSLPS